MKERTKLRCMRLLAIPYGMIVFPLTVVGFVLLGLPSWVLTGNCRAWIPAIFNIEDYIWEINRRQRQLDRNRKR